MENPFKITFSDGRVAEAMHADASVNLATVLNQFGLEGQRPALVVIGGASKLSADDFDRVRQLFITVLAPLAQKWQAVVIDGGTDAGVMRLMGEARSETQGTFPLIGVTPIDLAMLPNQPPPSAEAAALEPNHTHFLLVPGSSWGDESVWIANLASAIGNSLSVTVLVNGGEVTWLDASQSVKADRLIVVIAGSGRTADILAAALQGRSADQRADDLVASGLVHAIDLATGETTLPRIIEEIFAAKG